MSTRSKILIVASLAAGALLLGLLVWAVGYFSSRTEIVFLDVGQGDAILISQGMNQVLIDGGRSGRELLARLGRHVPFWDRRIETVILTHPDADHIGGFADLFRAYRVGTILATGVTSDTDVVGYMEKARKEMRQPEPLRVAKGTQIEFPHEGALLVEYPRTAVPERVRDTNATSIVTRFVYGETSFLLTGDLAEEEKAMPDVKPAAVLKAAHHGSKYSTSRAFLEKTQPREAVISVGKNNYGHPAPEVLERLKERGVIIRRTDESGDIRYVCSRGERQCRYEAGG